MIYFKIDSKNYGGHVFNRAFLRDQEIIYGEGYAQLRQKEEMRIALNSALLKGRKYEYIFIERHAAEIKELNKEGHKRVISTFEIEAFERAYQDAIQSHKIR